MTTLRYSSVCSTNQHGFTLLEILIAVFIFGVVLSTIYSSYVGTSRIVTETEYQADIYSMARITLDRMHEDLESIYVSQNPEPAESDEDNITGSDFVGDDTEIDGRDADSLQFLSRAHIIFSEKDQPSGTARIEYYVKQSEEESYFVLHRSDTPELEEPPGKGTGGLVLCEKLLSIDFTYYDAKGEEYDNWDSTTEAFKGKIPSMVSILLEFENRLGAEAPYMFLTTVTIPMGGETKEAESDARDHRM
ncbi:MAG: prepilin-type N-terminal cleavage/methylation domain-containing protein [Deltaproteobacteria bacterium]|nr:prepilin-type N-terminal cleavage/methylation domain-containing protein [Deltaproteobacteria bacterium]